MKKFITIILFSFLVFQFSLAQKRERIGEIKRINDSVFVSINEKLYVANKEVVTVKLKSGVDMEKAGFKTLRQNQLGYIDITVPDSIDLEDFVAQLDKTGYYEIIEYNSFGEYCFIPNDTRRANQWYLSNINAYSAWDITMGSPDVIVAVLDSGTDWMHPDIGMGIDAYQNIYLNPGEDVWQNVNNTETGNGIDDDNNGFIDDWKGWNFDANSNNVRTTNGHGTRVTGIVSAKSNNGEGIAGIAGGNNSEGAKIIPVCVGVDTPNSAILDDAIIYAVNSGAQVIQLSLTIARTNAIDAAISFAVENEVVIVCASGNNYSATVSYPASHEDVIAVGATAKNNSRANFSNYGTALDVVAPGVDIFSTTLNNGYNSQDGTSFSAPQISGVAALILSINPCLTQSEVRNIIESTAQKVGGYSYTTTAGRPNGTWNNQMGYGLVNAYAAVQKARPSISGPSQVCSTGATFTLNNLPQSVNSIVWTHGSNLAITAGQNSASCSFSALGNGDSWIRATLTTDCGGTLLPKQTVRAGVPDTPTSILGFSNNGIKFGSNQVYSFSINPGTNLSHQWTVSGGTITGGQGSASITVRTANITGYDLPFSVSVRTGNTCGWSSYLTRSGYIIAGTLPINSIPDDTEQKHADLTTMNESIPVNSTFTISPNPTAGEVTIYFNINPIYMKERPLNLTIEIYNASQQLITRQKNIENNYLSLNTSGWGKGLYIVTVTYNGEVFSEKLVVK